MRRIVFVVLFALMAACASLTSTGRLVSLEDGSTITLNMKFSRWGGSMAGTHPTTGETFTGDYTATQDGIGGVAAGTAVVVRNTTGQGKGVLVGDQGTVLDCQISVNAGNTVTRKAPTGNGTCTDQHGRRYRLQF